MKSLQEDLAKYTIKGLFKIEGDYCHVTVILSTADVNPISITVEVIWNPRTNSRGF